METTLPRVRELPIVGGHLALDFVNTVDDPLGGARHDHIGTGRELIAWSLRVGTITAGQASLLQLSDQPSSAISSGAVVSRAHAFRAVLFRVFDAAVNQTRPPWDELRPYVADAVAHAVLNEGYQLSWAGETAPNFMPNVLPDVLPNLMLWPVAHAAERLLTGPELNRVKQCAGCPWFFLDRSRNGSRRWCAMNDCGTQAKIVKYVARRSAARAQLSTS